MMTMKTPATRRRSDDDDDNDHNDHNDNVDFFGGFNQCQAKPHRKVQGEFPEGGKKKKKKKKRRNPHSKGCGGKLGEKHV